MDLKDKVTVWAGLLTLAVLQVQDRVDTELNLYGSDWVGAVVTIVYYVIGFVVVFGVLRWILERYSRENLSHSLRRHHRSDHPRSRPS